jgi:hypothetical protein
MQKIRNKNVDKYRLAEYIECDLKEVEPVDR